MRPRPILFAVTATSVVLAIVFAGRSASVARSAAETQRKAKRALAAERTEFERAAETARKRAAEIAAAEQARAVTTASESSETTASSHRDSTADAAALARAQKLARYRAGLDGTWGLLIAQLNLTPEQAAAFKDLLCRREENDLFLQAKAAAEGLTESSPEISALDDAFLAPWKNELRALLGSKGYASYRDYYHDREVAPLVTEMVAASEDTELPMATGTAVAVMRALGNASDRTPSGTAISDTLNWAKADELVKPLLSPEQYTVFQTIGTRIQAGQRVDAYLQRLAAARPTPK